MKTKQLVLGTAQARWCGNMPLSQQRNSRDEGDRVAHAAPAEPPLTATGRLRYGGILAAAVEVSVTGNLPTGNTTGTVTYFVVDRSRNAIVGQVVLPNAATQNTSVAIPIKVPSGGGSYEIGTFDANGAFQPSSFLKVSGPGGARSTAISMGAVGA